MRSSSRSLSSRSASKRSRRHAQPVRGGADLKVGQVVVYIRDADPSNAFIGRKRALPVYPWSTVHEVKDELCGRLHVPTAHQTLTYDGVELRNHHQLSSYRIEHHGAELAWSFCHPNCSPGVQLHVSPAFKCPKALRHRVLQAKRALFSGIAPIPSMDGTSGTYFLNDMQGQYAIAFKPGDEEPFAENSKLGAGHDSLSMRNGIRPGTSCYRETLAFALDHHGFSGVPMTTMVSCGHPKFRYHDSVELKLGSAQEFVPNAGVAEDYSSSKFRTAEVHKIGILDIRLLNCDRNAANILVKDTLELVPIDHGFCFPEVLEIGWCDWCWLDWPASKEPFDAATRRYILALDPDKDAESLRAAGVLPEPAACLVRVAGRLLQHGCREGLTLHTIANLLVRQDLENQVPSALEKVLQDAGEGASQAVLEKDGVQCFFCDCSPQHTQASTHSSPVNVNALPALTLDFGDAHPIIHFKPEPATGDDPCTNTSPDMKSSTASSSGSLHVHEHAKNTFHQEFWRQIDEKIAQLIQDSKSADQ